MKSKDPRNEAFFQSLTDDLKRQATTPLQNTVPVEDDPIFWQRYWVYPVANPHAGYGDMSDIYMVL